MGKAANVVLRILVIVSCVVLLIAGLYLFCVESINSYYAPADGDVFYSSMSIKNIFPMNDGRIVVCGTFLTGDNVYGNRGVFFKAYDKNGRVSDITSLTLDESYSYSDTVSDGEVILLVSKNARGDIKTYDISYDFDIVSVEEAGFETTDVTGVFAGLVYSDSYVAEVRNGCSVKISSRGKTVIDTEFTEDVFIDNISFAGNTFFLTGYVRVGTDRFPYISGFSINSVKKFETTVSERFRDFTIDGFEFLANGRTYVTGRQFNEDAYVSLMNTKYSEESMASVLETVGNRAVISEREYGSVLIGGLSYEQDPWCSRFICPIDADSGELGDVVKLLNDGPDLGITDIFYHDAYNLKTNATTDNPSGKPVIATLVTKNAESTLSENYLVNVYLLYGDMTTSKSANITVPSDTYYYPGTAPDGSLFVYSGMTGKGDGIVFSMKNYRGTAAAAEEQRRLPAYKQITSYVTSKITPRAVMYICIFLLLYITARFRGTSDAAKVKESERIRL